MIQAINFTVAYTRQFRKDMDALSQFAKIKLDWNAMFDPRFLKKADPSLVEM